MIFFFQSGLEIFSWQLVELQLNYTRAWLKWVQYKLQTLIINIVIAVSFK